MRAVLAFALCCLLTDVHSQTVKGYRYQMLDRKPVAFGEFHCFDLSGSNPNYVRGTFGHRAYFEGPVAGTTATVKVWTVRLLPPYTPIMGTATLTYTNSWKNVSGEIIMVDGKKFASWTSGGGTSNEDPSSEEYVNPSVSCLYAEPNRKSYPGALMVPGFWNGFQGETWLCNSSTEGMIGAFTYRWERGECESDTSPDVKCNGGATSKGFYRGHLDHTTRSAIYVGMWQDWEGPYLGSCSSGSNVMVTLPGSLGEPTWLRGFNCGAGGVDCYPEAYVFESVAELQACQKWMNKLGTSRTCTGGGTYCPDPADSRRSAIDATWVSHGLILGALLCVCSLALVAL